MGWLVGPFLGCCFVWLVDLDFLICGNLRFWCLICCAVDFCSLRTPGVGIVSELFDLMVAV